ncbi:hypothetical protein VE03_00357 [Pseudogymnoascus sp. 23342-1-I1]|nr:hypothetical protein VE03_00357 [Pseudogymnoascus sp. 23342-1-I1]
MPSYGSLHSPSLRKMNGNMDSSMRGRSGGIGGMSMDNIIGDPFALATLSIAALAWLIALVGSIVTDVNGDVASYVWFAVFFMLACIIGVFVVIASNTSATYHVALVAFLAIGFTLTSSAINGVIFHSEGSMNAMAAGNILLCMVTIVWIFYFGSTPSAVSRAYLDSFALHKEHPSANSGRGMSHAYGSGRPDTSISRQAPQMYTSAQLNGFETSSPVQSGFTNGGMGADKGSIQQRFGNSPAPVNPGAGAPSQIPEQTVPEVVAPTEYPYRAKAIYSYEANPDDANEISFSKHEILEVSDVSGRWWQAKKANGDTGIAPSNYLILL